MGARAGAWTAAGCGAAGLVALACRALPGLARGMLEGFSRPATLRLHLLTAPVPFPVAEAAALGLVAALALSLAGAVVRVVAGKSLLPLRRWLTGAVCTALALGVALALLWEPARALPGEAIPPPGDGALARLCEALIDELNAAPEDFLPPGEALRLAPEVAGAPGAAVKAARYPEWMDAARVSGLFVPLTGEAIVNADAPAPLVPFTAVHELAHLAGIADEGAANVAAWNRCMAAGGAFAHSARLWALRYALGMLRQRDGDAWRRAVARMDGATAWLFRDCGGEIVPAEAEKSPAAGLLPVAGDYGALVGYVAGN